jgi:hypothetical protein
MRLHEYAHQVDTVIGAVPQEHRPTLLAWLAARFDADTGERLELPAAAEISIRCEDCPELATVKCETCPTLRAFDDTEIET